MNETLKQTIERIANEPREIWLERVNRVFGSRSLPIEESTKPHLILKELEEEAK